MTLLSRRGVVVGLAGLLLAGCQTKSADKAPESGPAAPPQPQATAPAQPAAPAQPEAPAPAITAKPAEGTLLNPKDTVRLILPDGWEQTQADDGALLQMTRRAPVNGVRVVVSLDYAVDEKLPAGATLSSVAKEFTDKLATSLADKQFALVDSKRVTVGGYQALAVRGDIQSDGRSYRLKWYLILNDKDGTFYTLTVLGPRDGFDQQVEPAFDSIAASLQL